MKTLAPVHIALVSPSDVSEERRTVEEVVERINRQAEKRGKVFRLRSWERVGPGFDSGGVQSRIDSEIKIEECDLIIAIFWKRYGIIDTPPYSRTAHEVRTAIDARRRSENGRPEVKIYFRAKQYLPSPDDLAEHVKVLAFRDELGKEGVLYREYDELHTFAMEVFSDLMDYLEDEPSRTGATRPLMCRATATPIIVRSEGFAERLGEIRLYIEGGSRREHQDGVELEITLWISTNITNRVDAHSITDIALVSERRTGGVLAFAKLAAHANPGQPNVVDFGRVRIPAGQSGIDDVLVIRGVRADANFTGVSSTFQISQIQALVEVRHIPPRSAPVSVLRQQFLVALVQRGLLDPVVALEKPECLYRSAAHQREFEVAAATLTVGGGFHGAFKNREQEGQDIGTPLALCFQNVPSGCRVFVTMFDLTSIEARNPLAISANATSNGIPIGKRKDLAEISWQQRVPMVEVGSELISAWEIIGEVGPNDTKSGLTFGIALVRRRGGPLPLVFAQVAAGFGSFYDPSPTVRQPSRTLPVPRFITGLTPQEIPVPDFYSPS